MLGHVKLAEGQMKQARLETNVLWVRRCNLINPDSEMSIEEGSGSAD